MSFCHICNKDGFIKLGNHFARVHKDVSLKDYYVQYISPGFDILCPICKIREKVFISFSEGFQKTCSNKDCQNKFWQNNFKKNCLEKYGVDNPSKLKEVKNKKASNNLQKYGVTNTFQLPSTKEIIKNKYGVDNVFKSKEVQDSFRTYWQTNLNVDNPSQLKDIKEKKKKTHIRNFGLPIVQPRVVKEDRIYSFQQDCVQDKLKQNLLAKYGVDNPSKSPIIRERRKKTFLNTYGVENAFQIDAVKEKKKETNIRHFGTPYFQQSKEFVNRKRDILKKANNTCLKKYGTKHYCSSNLYRDNLISILDKITKTCLRKYGAKRYTLSSLYKENLPIIIGKIVSKGKRTCLERYGVSCYPLSKEYRKQLPIIQHNIYLTKKKNNSFHTSSTEASDYIFLLDHYPDVKRHYRDKRYPFECDFYIPNKDMFIEEQGMWTHGDEPFNKHNIKHLVILNKLIEGIKRSKFYKNAIYVWTDLDVRKRSIAKQNNLNYLELFGFDLSCSKKHLLRCIEGLKVQFNKEELQKEYNYIISKKGTYKSNFGHNKIVLFYQQSFFEIEQKLWRDSVIREKLIRNRIRYLNKEEEDLTDLDLLRGFKISGIHIGYSHFSPLCIKKFIEDFNITSIYDPCGGWGHRLLGVGDVRYIYNDVDEVKMDNCFKIAQDFNIKNKLFCNEEASSFIPPEAYDAVFVCPPYFDTEKYNCKNDSINLYPNYKDWLNVWWRNVVKNSLKKCKKYFVLVISNKYKKDMIRIVQECGTSFLEEHNLGLSAGHLSSGKVITKGENLVIFKK